MSLNINLSIYSTINSLLLIHNGKLIIPYGVSDSSTAFAEIDMGDLITKLKEDASE
jgi:predicted GH43/DUF377 family glycosyl hydrolase